MFGLCSIEVKFLFFVLFCFVILCLFISKGQTLIQNFVKNSNNFLDFVYLFLGCRFIWFWDFVIILNNFLDLVYLFFWVIDLFDFGLCNHRGFWKTFFLFLLLIYGCNSFKILKKFDTFEIALKLNFLNTIYTRQHSLFIIIIIFFSRKY